MDCANALRWDLAAVCQLLRNMPTRRRWTNRLNKVFKYSVAASDVAGLADTMIGVDNVEHVD